MPAASSFDSPPDAFALRLHYTMAAQHRALEAALDLLRPGISREQYVATLVALHGFLSPWEVVVTRQLSPQLETRVRQRRHVWRLVQDITTLTGYAPENLGSENCATLPLLDAESAALGSMFVIESAMLEGQRVAAYVREKFGLTPETGCAYFSGYGEQNVRMGSAFRELLNDSVVASERDRALRAAVDTLDCLHDWLAEKGVARPRL